MPGFTKKRIFAPSDAYIIQIIPHYFFEINGKRVINGRGHLACDKALPNQFVQTILIGSQRILDLRQSFIKILDLLLQVIVKRLESQFTQICEDSVHLFSSSRSRLLAPV